jgi:hypothetical protein
VFDGLDVVVAFLLGISTGITVHCFFSVRKETDTIIALAAFRIRIQFGSADPDPEPGRPKLSPKKGTMKIIHA